MSPYCQINMQHTIDKQIKRKEGGFRNSIGNNIKFFFLMCNNSVDVLDQKKTRVLLTSVFVDRGNLKQLLINIDNAT